MTELGVGYLSIVADTSRLPRQVQSALDGAQSTAERSGQSMGAKLASGLGKTLKIGAVAAGVAVGGTLASSINKGLERLTAIDNAEGKLKSLGNSTAQTAKIMDSALAAVKGTSYGLGDAATLAATAVAAGVKPGKDLTKYLSQVADASSIAGVGLSEMGSIFGKVQTQQRAYTMEINMLADRGIPIYQYLQQELGVTQEQLRKMVAAGEVDAETYFRALDKNLGGAATAATTVSSAWSNLGAASGRFGATLAGPIFRQAVPAFSALTKGVDELDSKAKPVMAAFEANLTGRYIPAVLAFGKAAVEGFEQFRDSTVVVTSLSRIGSVLDQLIETGKAVGPALGSIGTTLAKASAGLGISTWEIFLTTLEASARILDVTLVPALELTAGLMENNEGAVVALVAAWMAFKTIPALVGRVSSALTPLTTRTTAAATGLRGIATATGGVAQVAGYGATNLGRFGSAIQQIGQRAPVVGAMQTSFLNAAAGATHFARTQGVAAGAMTGLRAAGSSLTGFLGGPWGMALAAATIAVINWQSSMAKANTQQRILADSVSNSATAQRELLDAMASGDHDSVVEQVASNVRALRTEQQQLADTGPGYLRKVASGWDILGRSIGLTRGETVDAVNAQLDAAESGQAISGTLDRLKITNEDLSGAVTGSAMAYDDLRRKILASGEGGEAAVAWLEGQRAEYQQLQHAMKQVGPAGIEIQSALKEISEAAGDSGTKLKGLERALKALGILETDAQAAMFEAADAVREIAKAAEQGVDPVGGLGQALLGLDGNLDPNMSNAKALRDQLVGLGGEFKNLVSSGLSGADAYAQIEGGLRTLAETYDLPIEKVAELARQFGVLPREADVLLSVEGADAAGQAIAAVNLRASELEGGKTISMIVKDEQAIQALQGVGLSVLKINEMTGQVEVTAKSDAALAAMQAVAARLGQLDAGVAVPKIDADATRFKIEDQATRDALANLDRSQVSPEIGALIDKFLAGRDVTLAELSKIDLSTAEPDVQLLIQQALAQAKVANDAIDQAARPRTANIAVQWSGDLEAARRASMGGGFVGPVSGLATGGRLPTSGPGTDRTDGFLAVGANGMPLARVDAGEWVINGRSSQEYDRELAAINAGTFPKLPGYQDGGRLLDFVMGRAGGARPLTGAPYEWGGVHWGDCSGAMSAIARFAVGLAPFAARFATGTMGSALSALGFMMGRGGPGDLRFGWFNGGPYGGHTAGTLPDGTNVEMGGSYGGGMVGGKDGADAAQFTDHAFLPMGPGFDWNDPGGYPAGGRGRTSRSGGSLKQRPQWTEKQQLDLEQAKIAVTQAEEARVKMEGLVGEGKKSQADLDAANKKIELAEQKVVDLQKKKDDVSSYVEDGPAPQAPRLQRAFTDAEIQRLDAQLAVEAANDRRNEVYDSLDATDLERQKADAELYRATEALKKAGSTDSSKSSDTPKTWSELGGNFAKDFVGGQTSDVLGVLGLTDELPGAVQAGQMLAQALNEQQAQQGGEEYLPLGPDMNRPVMTDPGTMGSPADFLADSPVIYDPSKGAEQWAPVFEEGLRRTGLALSNLGRTIEQGDIESGGDPKAVGPDSPDGKPEGVLQVKPPTFAAYRDPELVNDPFNPLANSVAAFKYATDRYEGLEKIWPTRRGYFNGGPVSGPGGIDNVPAWLTAGEFVVKAAASSAGANPAILQAINSGAKFVFGQQGSQGGGERTVNYNFYGVTDADDAYRKWRTHDMQKTLSQLGAQS
ncbi:MAG: hypothetical protein EOP24_27355 [Hyphomicrobiales bacterium]|nr:MAG: hypothetical protein EOP24_27355 [Hyphomicrobiales bacterium]